MAHQAHPPDLARQGAKAATNLDAVLIEQVLAEGLAIHPFGDAHGGQGGQAPLQGHVQLQTEGLEASPKALGIAAVARPGVFDALFGQQAQGLAHAEVHVHRRRVVVHPVAAPVLVQQAHIQVPVGHLAATGVELGLGPGAHGEGTQARRAAEALLAAAIGQIHLPLVQFQGHGT